MSSQVSSRPTNSITGPALDSQVLRGGERRRVAPCGPQPSSSHEGWSWSLLGSSSQASQVVLVVKNLPANAGDMRGRFDPWVGKIPWRHQTGLK